MNFNRIKQHRIFALAAVLMVLAAAVTGSKTGDVPAAVLNTDCPDSFNKAPFINPKIIQDLSAWISDEGDQIVAINLSGSQGSNRYFGDTQVREIKGQNPYVFISKTNIENGETNNTEFGYQYIGQSDSGIHVLLTSDWGGGSGVFKNLLLVTFEHDHGITCDWDKGMIQAGKQRLLIRKLGEIDLGDRWDGDIKVKGNSIIVGKDRGWFTVSGGTGRKWSNFNLKADVLKIDLNH